ncbi:MAG: tripartite tricarboxylate transporter permease [Gammaproteobacteria bacterium]|nr:tripartite tricarboxylate transporter permease [Gammaproteobacteria bacterium]
MEAVLQAAVDGFWLVFSWPNILYPVAGTLLAMLISLIPGVSGVALMAMAIPFTLTWDPLPIMLLFGAFVGGATFMGSVTAILLNIPGKNSNAATLIDGYPMAQQGRARTAIGSSAMASALGSTVGLLMLILLIPFMRPAMLWLGPAELLMLVIWGLTTVAVLARGSPVKGLAMAGIGCLLAFVGLDPHTAEPRYTFDTLFLQDGLKLVPVFIGIFALAESLELAIGSSVSISGRTRIAELKGSLFEGVASVFRHFGVFLRCSILGTLIGMIPGIGGTVASFAAYGHAAAHSKDGTFGRGDVRGVIAPEAANDAKDGGAFVPTLAFGIPGGSGTAMLLTVLTLHGIAPGRDMLTTHADLMFVLIWSLFLSNWITSLLGMACVTPLARVTLLPTQRLVPFIVVIGALAAYLYRQQMLDVVVAFIFGIVGFLLKRYDWPRIPFVIALILTPLFENYLNLTMQLQAIGRIDFWSRPGVLLLVVLTVVSLLSPHVRKRRGGQGGASA